MVWVVWNTETANQTVGVNSQILRPKTRGGLSTSTTTGGWHTSTLAGSQFHRSCLVCLEAPRETTRKKNRRGSEITAWKIPWRWMDDNWFRNVFSDGLKDNQLSLDQLGRISILTFSVVWVLKGDADRIWRHTGHFFLGTWVSYNSYNSPSRALLNHIIEYFSAWLFRLDIRKLTWKARTSMNLIFNVYNICNNNTNNNNNNNIQYILWVFSSTNQRRFQNVKDQQLPPKTNKKEPEFFHPP